MKINEELEPLRDAIKLELKPLVYNVNELGLRYEDGHWIVNNALPLPKKSGYMKFKGVSKFPVGIFYVSYRLPENEVNLIRLIDTVWVNGLTIFMIGQFDKSLLTPDVKRKILLSMAEAVSVGKKIRGTENLPKSMQKELVFL